MGARLASKDPLKAAGGRVATAKRWYGEDDPRTVAAIKRLEKLRQDEAVRKASAAIVDDAPLIESVIAMLRDAATAKAGR